jgi:uncharacterized damage-inducible protein DinB
MKALLADLVAHKAHANAAMVAAVSTNAVAAGDPEILALLHHILVANRFWICVIRGDEFEAGREMAVARAIPALSEAFRRTEAEEAAWLGPATDADCARVIKHPFIPGGACTVAEAFTQVCMHSHGHRSQLAKLFRARGGEPPAGDFILWLADRERLEGGDDRPPGAA